MIKKAIITITMAILMLGASTPIFLGQPPHQLPSIQTGACALGTCPLTLQVTQTYNITIPSRYGATVNVQVRVDSGKLAISLMSNDGAVYSNTEYAGGLAQFSQPMALGSTYTLSLQNVDGSRASVAELSLWFS